MELKTLFWIILVIILIVSFIFLLVGIKDPLRRNNIALIFNLSFLIFVLTGWLLHYCNIVETNPYIFPLMTVVALLNIGGLYLGRKKLKGRQ